jgi:hypothetical protein
VLAIKVAQIFLLSTKFAHWRPGQNNSAIVSFLRLKFCLEIAPWRCHPLSGARDVRVRECARKQWCFSRLLELRQNSNPRVEQRLSRKLPSRQDFQSMPICVYPHALWSKAHHGCLSSAEIAVPQSRLESRGFYEASAHRPR